MTLNLNFCLTRFIIIFYVLLFLPKTLNNGREFKKIRLLPVFVVQTEKNVVKYKTVKTRVTFYSSMIAHLL